MNYLPIIVERLKKKNRTNLPRNKKNNIIFWVFLKIIIIIIYFKEILKKFESLAHLGSKGTHPDV